MEKCWICHRTKEEIIKELNEMNISHKKEDIFLTPAEESDFPKIMYCSVCENVLGDFIIKEGVVFDEEDMSDSDSEKPTK
ncbi:MAG: hypothetical protein V1776_03360 [Candidatus Diapherotrites archaeon]